MATQARQDRKQAILDAADQLFGSRGFAAVSMRDVAEAAGVNKALLFYYFGGKDQLFEAVLERYYADHAAVMAAAFADELPLAERLHGGIDAYLDFIEANQRYPRLVQSVVSGSPEHHPLIEENLRMLYSFVEQTLRDVAPAEGPLAARQFFLTLSASVINTFTYAGVLSAVWDKDPLGDEALAERRAHIHWLVDTLLQGLATRRP